MKFPLFKTLVAAGTLALICSCSEDTVSRVNHEVKGNYVVADTSYVYTDKNNNVYLISSIGIVSDTNGVQVGLANIAEGYIIDNSTNVIASGINFSKLEKVSPTKVTGDGWLLNMGANYIVYETGYVCDAQGNTVGVFVPTAGTTGNIVGLDGATLLVEGLDLSTLKRVSANVGGETPMSSGTIITSSGSNPGISSANNPGISSASNPGTSSAVVRSSSSSAKSSSSSAAQSSSSTGGNGSCPTIKYVNGGASGSGFASRYWDCCKPSCSWNENAGGNLAKQCDNRGNLINDPGSQSMCNGGNAGACVSQIPFTINGCTTYGFAFAAVPASNGGKCGHCYELTFTGEGHYNSTNANTKRLKTEGKKLIVMASNVGSDVTQGQFDVMIPGGGFGIFDGCSNRMGWGSQGEQYGGLLSQCEKSSNYNAGKYKSCLTEKCNSSFANDPVAKEGCLFLANWMNSAGNPEHTYKEVECPDVLKQKY